MTGPCVYPAGHIWIFSLIYWGTEKGDNIFVRHFNINSNFPSNSILPLITESLNLILLHQPHPTGHFDQSLQERIQGPQLIRERANSNSRTAHRVKENSLHLFVEVL